MNILIKNKYESLKDEYGLYSRSNEAVAVYFVKSIVSNLDTKDKWIDIISYERYPNYDKPAFKNLEIELFERKIKPKYPKDADVMLKRAMT